MAFGWNEGIKLGGLLLGALGPKDSGPRRGPRAKRNYKNILDETYNWDPVRAGEDAANEAKLEAEKVMGRVVGNIVAPYAGAGSHGWLPDSRRDSLIRGGMSDVGSVLAKLLAEIKMNAVPMKARLMREMLDPVGGGGGAPPNFGMAGGFAELMKDIFRRKKVDPLAGYDDSMNTTGEEAA